MVQYDTIKLRQPSSVSFVVVVLIDQILQVGITEHTLRQLCAKVFMVLHFKVR